MSTSSQLQKSTKKKPSEHEEPATPTPTQRDIVLAEICTICSVLGLINSPLDAIEDRLDCITALFTSVQATLIDLSEKLASNKS